MRTPGCVVAVAVGLGGLLAGCSGLTPTQELAWDRWKACDHFATIRMTRIGEDGHIVVTGREYETAVFAACVQRVALDQSRRGAAVGDTSTTAVGFEGAQRK